MPKGFRKQLKLVPQIVGVPRRQELLDNIADSNGFLPQGVHIKDMDTAFVDFVTKNLQIEIDGEEVPVIFLTIQRYADFKKTWKFTDEYKNVKMPFITIVRNPDVQKGTNQAALANIPGHRNYSYYKVPSNDGARLGMDIYKIPQPTAVDITYEVRFFSNKMSDVNVMHNVVHKTFNATQAYIYPKNHPMPITLPTITDESNIEDFESRRFYVEAYEMLLAGYILDEEDFIVTPTVNRAMVLSEISSDPATAEGHPNPNKRTPVIRTQGSVIIRNSSGVLLATTDCNSTYIVGNSDIINSGATFSVSVPATSGYTLPNVVNYDSDGSPILTPAMVGFTATTCDPVTIINSGTTYSASTPAGSTFQLPNVNIHSSSSGFTEQIPSVIDYEIADVNWTDTDSTPQSTEYGQPIVCTPQVQSLTIVIEVGVGDDTSELTIIPNSEGTITTLNSGGLTITDLQVNAVSVSVPFSVVDTDVVTITYNAAASAATIIMTGTY